MCDKSAVAGRSPPLYSRPVAPRTPPTPSPPSPSKEERVKQEVSRPVRRGSNAGDGVGDRVGPTASPPSPLGQYGKDGFIGLLGSSHLSLPVTHSVASG
jgi:hypothetical protein